MTSSTLTGERRWASSRRGGMTVLGKVAVPKPINLPSQRLENHGLDPNVEIVPKGTLSWSSRSSSSSATNAWGSSSLSPNTDGTISPSHLSARPSSGGSGTRPSTAGSDRALEPTPNAWGSTSRPSSASGALTSNQTSLTSMRPRSAETRPGSSQLSRFAEPMAENSVAWSASRTAEKLGATQGKSDEFSLSSGDFPSLGSEKDKSVKNSELQDHSSHSCPGSSSGVGKEKTEISFVDDVPMNANVKDGAVNSWRRDCPVYSEDGERPSIEKWQGNPQPYPNAVVPPQHYDAWHGPPVNNPQGGVWFRGPPGGPPFGNPVAPGGFPMEPFSYYRPHIPPTALGNPPAVPPPASGPRSHHPNNGDVYRPHMPDAYIRPGMPIRPGFYPGPMAYEGYYGPPMGFCNSNERDVPFTGMAAGPPIYNRYTNQNPTEHDNSQGRAGGYGSAAKPLASEHVESSHSSDTSRPYRVLLKQHNECDGKNEPSNWEDCGTITESCIDGKDQPRMPTCEDRQRSDYRKNQDMDLRASACGEKACSQTPENQESSSSVIVNAKSSESTGNIRTSNDISARKLDGAASDVQVPSRRSVPKDSNLIQKIECLNAKARDNSSAKNREEQRNKFHSSSIPVNPVENEVSTGVSSLFPERNNTTEVIYHFPCELVASGGEKNVESLSSSGAPTYRRTANGMQGRADCNKGRSNAQDTDGWQKKSVVADTSILSPAQMEATSAQVGDHHISVGTYDKSGSYKQARHDGESVQTMSNPIDRQAQHAEMKELGKQHIKQNQEEEEEQTRQQKAEAVQIHSNVVPKQKRMGYKQRLNVQAEKTSHEKLVPTPTTLKVENHTSIDLTVSTGNVTNEIGSTCLSGLVMNSNAVAESSAIQKKKNNRNGKSKQKVEETSSLPAITKEGKFSRSSTESDKPKTSEFELDQDSVQPAFISKDPNQCLEHCRNLPNEECHGRNSQWKSQHPRRMPRNMQINRPVEKSHGNDAVMWAPVKPQNRAEIMDELTDKNKIEAVNFVKSDQQVHGNLKNKRAEMERYVPKPVAKEMAQHGGVQQVASSSNQSATDETIGGGDSGSHVAHVTRHTNSAVAKAGSGMDYKNGDGRQSKQGKVHGSWRQRSSMESNTNMHDMQEALIHVSDSYQSVQRSTEHQQAQRSELSSVKGPAKHVDDSSYADGPKNSNSHGSAALVSTTVTRDQTSGRGRRVPFRGNKNDDFDQKREIEKIEKQVSSTEPSQQDTGAAFKENRGAGERLTSHWQPKSQPSNHQHGNRSNEQNVGPQVGRVNKNDSATPSGVSLLTGSNKETNDHIVPPPCDQSMSERKTKAGPGPHSGNQEAKRERRNAPPKGRPQSPNQVPFGSVEHDPSSVDLRHDQRPSSGFRKNGNQNRFGRGHESRDWKSPGQDNRHYHQLGNREKQGQNMHYEYCPVGPYDRSKVTSSERPKDDNHSGARFRDRGQTHSRRSGGNFHVRQGGSLD